MGGERAISAFGLFTIADAENARNELKVGDLISFTQLGRYGRRKTTKGLITDKFEHIFVLDNGKSYQYVDYVIGGGSKHGRLYAM